MGDCDWRVWRFHFQFTLPFLERCVTTHGFEYRPECHQQPRFDEWKLLERMKIEEYPDRARVHCWFVPVIGRITPNYDWFDRTPPVIREDWLLFEMARATAINAKASPRVWSFPFTDVIGGSGIYTWNLSLITNGPSRPYYRSLILWDSSTCYADRQRDACSVIFRVPLNEEALKEYEEWAERSWRAQSHVKEWDWEWYLSREF